jgi:hypothetical protein
MLKKQMASGRLQCRQIGGGGGMSKDKTRTTQTITKTLSLNRQHSLKVILQLRKGNMRQEKSWKITDGFWGNSGAFSASKGARFR